MNTEENDEEEFTNEQFLIWIKAYSEDVEEVKRLYWANNKNDQTLGEKIELPPTNLE